MRNTYYIIFVFFMIFLVSCSSQGEITKETVAIVKENSDQVNFCGGEGALEDIELLNATFDDIKCSQIPFIEKVNRENYTEYEGLVVSSYSLELILKAEKNGIDKTEIICDNKISNFRPSIKNRKIIFKRDILYANADCNRYYPPEYFTETCNELFLKTVCIWNNTVELEFLENELESHKKIIIGKESIVLPYEPCNAEIDENSKEFCYKEYQDQIFAGENFI